MRQHNGAKRILIIDDEEIIVNIMKRRFERLGFEVETAHTGIEAVDILANAPIDLVLADMKMPDNYSGHDIMELAKQHQPEAPFVLMSGQILSEDTVNDFMKNGAAMFVKKPFSSLSNVTKEIAELANNGIGSSE